MSMSNAAETAWLTLLLNNTNWANIGDATGLRGSTVAGSLYIALHTADPIRGHIHGLCSCRRGSQRSGMDHLGRER